MTWAKVDDRFHSHRKIKRAWRIERGALGLHVMAISYCADHLTDGLVDDEFVEEKLPDEGERMLTTGTLVKCDLWVRVHDGWQINDWLEYNPSREDVLDRRRRDADRKARGRRTQATSPNGNLRDVRADISRSPRGVSEESDGPVPTRTKGQEGPPSEVHPLLMPFSSAGRASARACARRPA